MLTADTVDGIGLGEGATVKHVLILVDGLADDAAGPDSTQASPLERASTPVLDGMASEGIVGRVKFVQSPPLSPSDAVLFALLGGDPSRDLPGRGGLEAYAAGQPSGGRGRVASGRLVSQVDGVLTDLTGGGISDAEAKLLLSRLNEAIGAPGFELLHLGGNQVLLLLGEELDTLPETMPPEWCLGRPYLAHLPRGPGGERLSAAVRASVEILERDEVNRVRLDLGENPANLLWIWGVADLPLPARWLELGNPKGALVSSDLWAAGMGLAFGLDPQGEGALVETDPSRLGLRATEALQAPFDLVVVHVSEPGRAGLAQDPRRKTACLERLDSEILRPLREHLPRHDSRLAVVSTWTVSSVTGSIQTGFNPFLLWGRDSEAGPVDREFTERVARESRLEVADGAMFREFFQAR
jgi:2,3-bisphosphoglycerate-independent phosphoglycerate mutase